MSSSDNSFLDDAVLVEEEDTFYTTKEKKGPRRPSKSKYSTLEARRAVEDFLLMKQYHHLYEQFYDC